MLFICIWQDFTSSQFTIIVKRRSFVRLNIVIIYFGINVASGILLNKLFWRNLSEMYRICLFILYGISVVGVWSISASLLISPANINDADCCDNEDFIPFKNDRHDTFDWRLLKSVLLTASGNVIISPFSIKLVLTLLLEAAGAASKTQKELSAILPNVHSPALVRELYKEILGSLKEESTYYDLNLGTKIYVDQFIEPRQRYAAIVHTHYNTEIERLDFHDLENSVKIVNNWCSNITANHLKNLISALDLEDSIMLITNAIYFNGIWKREFLKNETIELPFFTHPSMQVRTDFMTQSTDFYYFESTKLNAKILRLPYKGKKFSMTILLPNAKGGLEELIQEIEGDKLKRLQWLMDEAYVKVSLPKFKFDYTAHLKETLQALGFAEIFTNSASLPGLARGSAVDNQLQVSQIIQKSGLAVHEGGSTIYSATEVSLTNKFGGRTEEDFNANRPFLFLVEDETTGTLLFAGKVVDPTK